MTARLGTAQRPGRRSTSGSLAGVHPVHNSGLIEIDADVVPGDSGGALLDADGDVVGMNVAASSGTADISGYDIPITTVLSVVRAIESGGH